MVNIFPASDEALAARLDAIDLEAYARTRNHLDGAVTKLSPYLTHGFTSVPEVIAAIRSRGPLDLRHKFIFELAWREYFHHVWTRLGHQIFTTLRSPPGLNYRAQLPEDLLTASTGINIIDHAVRTLYDTGYLHNHARMWLASYAVHLRKVDWLAGADWMYGHLLDGDLPSNHLSWQWVAGTLTGRPYLFNADNVSRYAPSLASRRSAIDQDYDQLRHIAESGFDVGPEARRPDAIDPPLLMPVPEDLDREYASLESGQLALAHPWSLHARRRPAVMILLRDFHQRWPWSARRWRFLRDRLNILDFELVTFNSVDIQHYFSGLEIQVTAANHPIYDEALRQISHPAPAPRQFANPEQLCRSFSTFWNRICAKPSDR